MNHFIIPLLLFLSHTVDDAIFKDYSVSEAIKSDSFAIIKIDSIKIMPFDSQSYVITSVFVKIIPKDTSIFLDTYPNDMEFSLKNKWGNYDNFICCVQKEARLIDEKDWLHLNKSGYELNLPGNQTTNDNNFNKLSIRFVGKIRINTNILDIQINSAPFNIMILKGNENKK